MDTILTTVLFLAALVGVVAALGVAARPRRTRRLANRNLREDLLTGVAVLRGWGEVEARRVDRNLEEMRAGTSERR
ncbi:MAG: hypothetical protein GEU86_22695 [Actinophytocola sp.]|nr:hypothetical protein [Actinophytocola sp.]